MWRSGRESPALTAAAGGLSRWLGVALPVLTLSLQFGHVPLRQGEGAEWTQACGALSPPPALPVTRAELRGPGGHQVKPERQWPPYR